MRLTMLALLLPFAAAQSQKYPDFPSMAEVRGWIQLYQPKLAVGDSGINGGLIVIDTTANYKRSVVFHLSERELAAADAVGQAVALQSDSAITTILYACVRGPHEAAPSVKPLCLLDNAPVPAIDHMRFLTGRTLEVMKADSAVKRFGRAAAGGAVVLGTDWPALERFKTLGVTPDNLVSFEGRRIRRSVDGASVVLTMLMLR